MSSSPLWKRARQTKKNFGFPLVLILLLLLSALPHISRAQLQAGRAPDYGQKQPRAEFVPGEVIVRFKTEAAADLSESEPAPDLRTPRGRVPMRVERFAGSEIVKGLRLARVPAEETLEAVEAFKRRADVLYAEPNYVRRKFATPNDPRFKEMWGLKDLGDGYVSSAGNDIEAEPAWSITTGSAKVIVGVVDEGIDINHPDLAANVWKNPGEIPNNSIDDDSNGFIDDVNGWDF
ncbi:MAG TPA: hypothetical protein VJ715_02365, partial [Pyrinomonadaceae bacterium]|nr:hypothetical protein [Pyrinomonadaceae bacterium]